MRNAHSGNCYCIAKVFNIALNRKLTVDPLRGKLGLFQGLGKAGAGSTKLRIKKNVMQLRRSTRWQEKRTRAAVPRPPHTLNI